MPALRAGRRARRAAGLDDSGTPPRGAAPVPVAGARRGRRRPSTAVASGAAPALLMLAPGVVHGFSYSRDSAGHQVTVPTAAAARAAGRRAGAGGLARAIVVRESEWARSRASCARCSTRWRASSRHAPGRVRGAAAHAALLAVVPAPRGAARRCLGRPPRPTRWCSATAALLERTFAAHGPLALYAGSVDVTPDHLSRRCRAVSGRRRWTCCTSG